MIIKKIEERMNLSLGSYSKELSTVRTGRANPKMLDGVRVRRDSLEELKKEQKDNNLSEDDLKKNSNEVQKITDLKIAEIDKKLGEKEVEILKV
jgi:ribosome recycling factor